MTRWSARAQIGRAVTPSRAIQVNARPGKVAGGVVCDQGVGLAGPEVDCLVVAGCAGGCSQRSGEAIHVRVDATGVAHQTVWRILQRFGLSRRPRAAKDAVLRYE